MSSTIEKLPINQYEAEYNYEQRHTNDTATWMAELLYGSMRTSFDFTFEGGEIHAEDGGSMDDVFDNAIAEAKLMSIENPSFMFELRRRIYERCELEDMKEMANGTLLTDKGEETNTIVVLSDFPPELMDSNKDLGGYSVNRKQTMMRIITKNENDDLTVVSRSLDHSDRLALEKVGLAVGHKFEEGELLNQRIKLNVPKEWQPKLENMLVDTYDDSLTEQFGGNWRAGIKLPNIRAYVNTYEFALSQQDLIQHFSSLRVTDPEKAESIRYNVAATVSERYERYLNKTQPNLEVGLARPKTDFVIHAISAIQQTLEYELSTAASRAARRGKVFSGCGITISSDSIMEGSLTDSTASRLGYGNYAQGKKNLCRFKSKSCPECKKTNVWTKSWEENGSQHIEGTCGCHKVKPLPKVI